MAPKKISPSHDFVIKCKTCKLIGINAEIHIDKENREAKWDALKACGFWGLTKVQANPIHKDLVKFLCGRYHNDTRSIRLPSGKELQIREEDVHRVYQLPTGPRRISLDDPSEADILQLKVDLGISTKHSTVHFVDSVRIVGENVTLFDSPSCSRWRAKDIKAKVKPLLDLGGMERGEFSMVNQSEPLLDHGGMDKGEFMMNQLEDMDATDNQFGLLELDADGGSPSGVETNASSVELTNENKEMFDLEQQNGCCYESFNFSCEKLPKMEEMIRIKENWEEVQPLVNNCSKSILVDMVIDTMLQAARTELQRMEEVARRVVYLLENMVQMAKHLNTAYKQHKARKIGQKVAAKVAAEKWVKAEKAAQIERKLKEERFLKEAELQRKEYENQEKEAADKERVVETHQAMVTAIPDPKDPVTLAMTLFKQGIDAQLAEMRRQNEEAHRRQEEAQRQYEDFLQKQLQLIHKQQSSEVKSFQMTVDALFAVVKEGEVRRAMLEEIVLKDRADVAERLKVGGSSNKGSNKREREEDKEIDASKKKRHEEQGKDQN